MATLHVRVVSPEKVVFQGEAGGLVAPAWDGMVGILPNHAPMIVLIGQGKPGCRISVSLDDVTMGREIIGQLNGGAKPERDYPKLIALARSGQIDLAAQVTHVWPVTEFEKAITALRAGEVTRAVLDHTV